MQMDMSVKINGEVLTKATQEKDSFNCKRREVRFDFMNGKWNYSLSCGGFGLNVKKINN